MVKYKYGGLMIEITRKCNLECTHCMRGEAQNITITKEIIDKIFENAEDCSRVTFTGGEPLLEIELIEYMVDKIIDSNWTTDYLELTTNGTIQDKRIIDVFERFCESKEKRTAIIRISSDRFHDIEQSKAAFEYYTQITKNKRLEIRYGGDVPVLVFSGRTKLWSRDMFIAHAEIENIFKQNNNHRVRIEDNNVPCAIQISSNGNVGFPEDQDYNTADDLTFGNILDKPMCELIQKNNSVCLLSCRDLEQSSFCSNWRFILKNVDDAKTKLSLELTYRIGEIILQRIYGLRILARQTYPYVSAQDIIELLPMPERVISYITKNIHEIYKSSDVITFDDLDKHTDSDIIEKYIDLLPDIENKPDYIAVLEKRELAELISVLTLLNKPNAKVLSEEWFGNSRDVFCSAPFQRLAELNEQYKSGEAVPHNDKILPCGDSGDSDFIDYYYQLLSRDEKDIGRILARMYTNFKSER